MKDQHFNLYLGLGIGLAAIIFATFVAGLMGAKSGEVATALATVISGSFVLGAAIIAWLSVQKQIVSQESIENSRKKSEIDGLEVGFNVEMISYSRGIIQAISVWNQRALKDPQAKVTTNWPVYVDPLYYKTNIGKIGLIRQQWAIAAVIGFYANLLELNEQAREFFAGRPTVDVTPRSILNRLHLMAHNLSQAMDGLNNDRKFPIPQEIRLDNIFLPDGRTVSQLENIPLNLQELLIRITI